MKESPLFWPVRLVKGRILCLDETALPGKPVYLEARTLAQAVSLIKTMKTRALGQVVMTYCILLLLLEKGKRLPAAKQIEALEKASRKIIESRPTFPFPFFTGMVLGWAREAMDGGEDIAGSTARKIKAFLDHLKERRRAQARELSELIEDGSTILTHCNVSGSLVAAAEFCRERGKKVGFYVTETRPYLQGSRLTAWELKRAGFEVTVIPDSSVAFVMSRGIPDAVVVGADQTARNGDFANKIGTYQIALLARNFGLPFYVLSPPPSRAMTGADIEIEIRPEKELLEFNGKRIAPKGVRGLYPAFDVTPAELVTRHVALEL
ncbi:MAG: S-methyl-5-thioribose-1-phosphate isomerase [Planctomycetota bacterium]|jgi:methylthioribose-1-phosphate isomerase